MTSTIVTVAPPRSLLAALVLVCIIPAALAAQEPGPDRLEGTVVRVDEGVADVPVALHRVTADSSGVIATTTTGPRGGFSFGLPPRDTAGFTVYFATAEYQTVRYFGDPVHPGEAPASYEIAVYDTASSLPGAIRVTRRDLVMLPHADGGWEVNEVARVSNTAQRTLFPQSGMPGWELRIPESATEFDAGGGDLRADQIQQMGDRVLLTGPVVPGERELFLRYRIPPSSRRVDFGMGAPVDTLNVFVQQPSPRLTVSGLRPTEVLEVEGQRFLQLAGLDLAADSTLRMEWEGGASRVSPVLAGVGAALLLLLIGAGAALRPRPS